MTLIEKLNQDNNYRDGVFTKGTKRRWLKAHMREATELQQRNGNEKPHKGLNEYKEELINQDWQITKIMRAIWLLDSRKSYTTTPVIQETKEIVRLYRTGNFRNLLVQNLQKKLKRLYEMGKKPPFIKDALDEPLTMLQRLHVSKVFSRIEA